MNKMKCLLLLFTSTTVLMIPQVNSQEQVLTLNSTVEMALLRNPMGKAAQINVQRAGFDVLKAKTVKYVPTMKFGLTTGLVPEARGDIFSSPDKMDDLNGFGPFYRTSFELIQPLLTFGKTTAVVEASEHAETLQNSQNNLVREKISIEAVKAYWGVSAALSAESLALDLHESYDQLLSDVEGRLADEDSEVDFTDLLEVKTLFYSVEEKYQKSREIKEISKRVLGTILDLSLEEDITISHEQAPGFHGQDLSVGDLIGLAERHRPDLDALNASLKIIQAKIDLAKRQRYPSVFLVAGLGIAHAGNRADQTNPFVVDNFNYRSVHAALGVQWNPNFLLHNIEVKKAEADYQLAFEKMKGVKAKIVLEVNRKFQAVRTNHALIEASRQSLKDAKTWLRVAYENWELGIGEVRRLLRAYEAYYRLKAVEIERDYDYNISLADLAHTLGKTDLYLDWVNDGNVSF